MTLTEAPIAFQGQLLWTDYLGAQRLHRRKRGWRRVAWTAFWGVILVETLVLGVATLGDREWSWPFLLLLLVLGGNVWAQRVQLPRVAKRVYTQLRSLQEPFHTTISGDGLYSESASTTCTRDWGSFIRWKEDAELFLLYQSDCMFNLLPKRYFATPDDVARCRALLEERLGPAA